jgi:hypothetical protein
MYPCRGYHVAHAPYAKTLVFCFSSAPAWQYMLGGPIMKRPCLCGLDLVLLEIIIFALPVYMWSLACSRSPLKNDFFLFFECSYVKIHVGWCYHEEGMLVWSRLSTTWNHDFCSICTHAGASTLLTLKMPWGFKALDAFTCMLLSSPEWHCRSYTSCVQFLDLV